MTVRCQRGCGRAWKRDPVLEVPCTSCNAPIGVKCRRPSGHSCEPHAPHDIEADRAGHYGSCPLGLCGLDNVAHRRNHQLSLFAEGAPDERVLSAARTPLPSTRTAKSTPPEPPARRIGRGLHP